MGKVLEHLHQYADFFNHTAITKFVTVHSIPYILYTPGNILFVMVSKNHRANRPFACRKIIHLHYGSDRGANTRKSNYSFSRKFRGGITITKAPASQIIKIA